MVVQVDTSVFVGIERGGLSWEDLDDSCGDNDRAISVITVSELLHGAARSSHFRARRLAFVERIIASSTPEPVTETIARVHGDLTATLARSGASIGANDSWIAATAIANGWMVATLDQAFDRVPGLQVISPSAELRRRGSA